MRELQTFTDIKNEPCGFFRFRWVCLLRASELSQSLHLEIRTGHDIEIVDLHDIGMVKGASSVATLR